MSDLHARLDEIAARRRPAFSPPTSPARVPPVQTTSVEALGGSEQLAGSQRYWHITTTFDACCPDHGLPAVGGFETARIEVPGGDDIGIEPPAALVVDIETGGFSGTPVFLIGLVMLDERPLRVHQLLARDYPEESAILMYFAAIAAGRATWISFNGKSFDLPFLRDRAVLNRIQLAEPARHVDLLHAARRRWRGELPDCRLQTLERRIVGRVRVGDVPGCDIPDLFHHFIRTSNAAPLRPVLEHNRIDLVTCAQLLHRLGGEPNPRRETWAEPGPGPQRPAFSADSGVTADRPGFRQEFETAAERSGIHKEPEAPADRPEPRPESAAGG